MSVVHVGNSSLLVTGRLLKIAEIHDEVWREPDAAGNPEAVANDLKKSRIRADIFTFAQPLPETLPKYQHYMEWDNFAVVPITTFEEWWTKRLPQVTRKNVRRAQKRGVVTRVVAFDDELVKGISRVYNETPIRQGRFFWHYGKEFDVVKKENATYLSNSDFIGAYCNNELIGFIKLVYVGKVARIMQIISMVAHQDKRPTNALLAKAVEICEKKNMDFLVYGRYVYGNKTTSSVIEFKVRNGFERVDVPRYFIPVTTRGELALRLKLHRGVRGLLPERVMTLLLALRSRLYEKLPPGRGATGARNNAGGESLRMG